ncbi:MAG TPA: DNA alkylation repair protein, partial [Cytophagales bacterium]|nr:DNA alkylation repair protein [Cytophagales bacterium]
MNEYLDHLEKTFRSNANPEKAAEMERYMKNKFPFLGIPSPERRAISRPFLGKETRPHYNQLFEHCLFLWAQPEREFQYFALDLAQKYLNKLEAECLDMMERMVVDKPWWDTVDLIASTLMGAYFKKYPKEAPGKSKEWIASGNIWLQRCALLFQLKYKNETNASLLFDNIRKLLGSQEFFINKAIGWALRQYSKFEPNEVRSFVQIEKSRLAPLSKREASKYIYIKSII